MIYPNVYDRMKELGITLPPSPPPVAIYSKLRRFGDKLVYTSGVGPDNAPMPYQGKLGKDFTVEEGQAIARFTMLNLLSRIQEEYDLNEIKSFVKILGFVASDPDFIDQPFVMNGASQVLKDIFGDEVGLPARSAIGVTVLPRNLAVEIEVIFELK